VNSLSRNSRNECGILNANFNQVQDYNALRKAKSAYIPNSHQRRARTVYNNQNEYEMYELNFEKTAAPSARSSNNRLLFRNNMADSYRSADGTIYKHYKLIDTDNVQVKEAEYPTKNVIHIPGKYHEYYRQWLNLNQVPKNLQHKFGSKQTAKLLENEIKVNDTLSQIHNRGMEKKSIKDDPCSVRNDDGKDESSESVCDYYDLGNHLRHVISHGYPDASLIKSSFKESVHNESVSQQYLSDWSNVESPYRRKKDWLSKYEFYFFSQRNS
jgi:hypothetical protein